MKKSIEKFLISAIGRRLRALQKKHQFKTVVVIDTAGSGEGTVLARLLNETVHVRHFPGNHSELGMLLQVFGKEAPSIFNLIGWVRIFADISKQVRGTFPYQIVILECEENISGLQQHLTPDVVVAPQDKSIQIPGGRISYDVRNAEADFHLANIFTIPSGFEADVKHTGEIYLHISVKSETEEGMRVPLAAVITARELELKTPQIQAGLAALWRPVKEAVK